MAGETPSREGSVSRFLDIFARGSAAAAFAALIAGKSLWVVGGFVFGALVLHLLGTRWPAIQTRLGPRLAAVVERVTSNRRYRIAAIVVVVGCFAVTGLMYVVKLRSDLDEYVMPRAVSKEQASKLKEYLAEHDAGAVGLRVVAHDSEAMEYASQLFNALRATKWNINPATHRGPEAIGDSDASGLCVETEWPGQQPGNPDPNHPTPAVVLQDAMRYAGIEANCNGGATNTGKDSTYLLGKLCTGGRASRI